MSFLSNIFTGSPTNQFKSTAPVNSFSATDPTAASTLAAANSQASGGAGPASGTIAQQSALSQQLQAASNGQGPNPALAQLQQTTSQNENQAAGTVASQRGINPALAARMALDAGANQNQTAAGQAATMEANQQIAARSQLGTNLASTASNQLNQQQAGTSLLGTAGGQNLQAQGINAGVANQNAALNLGSQQINAGVQGQNAAVNAGMQGGFLNALGQAVTGGSSGGTSAAAGGGGGGAGALALLAANGGEIPDSISQLPNITDPNAAPDMSAIPSGDLHTYLDSVHPSGFQTTDGFGGFQSSLNDPKSYGLPDPNSITQPAPTAAAAPAAKKGSGGTFNAFPTKYAGLANPMMQVAGAMYATGGSIHQPVPVQLSPGEIVVPRGVASDPAKTRSYVASASKLPGTAKVQGDSPVNDVIKTKLKPGTVVVPRTKAKDPEKASSFVASVMKRSGGQRLFRGGIVHQAATTPQRAAMGMGRSLGGDETRRRIKSATAPMFAEPLDEEG